MSAVHGVFDSVSLPSIQEMFPDHLMVNSQASSSNTLPDQTPDTPSPTEIYDHTFSNPHATANSMHIVTRPHSNTIYAAAHAGPGDSSGLQQHLGRRAPVSQSANAAHPMSPSSSTMSRGPYPSHYLPTTASTNTSQAYINPGPSTEYSLSQSPGTVSEGDSLRRHICHYCNKRFNRPSSLRIHLNTHSGATPFKCPWPNCGREFNVNSNMRRHYRNHSSSSIITDGGPGPTITSSVTLTPTPPSTAQYAPGPAPPISPAHSAYHPQSAAYFYPSY